MKGISAEKTLSSLRSNDHCDPEHAEPSLDATLSPTQDPTYAPTAKPTSAPTRDPTSRPTQDPTYIPTAKPTSAPTPVPTSSPTSDPTYVPTAKPTSAPTRDPTSHPTQDPTYVPTAKPTSAPTPVPTSTPTKDPTYVPTSKPTSAPTPVPTSPPTSSTTRKWYPRGVQLNSVSVANLTSYGCSVCYLQTYSAWTFSREISDCTGPVLFVGGRATSSSSFTLGAFDSSTSIITETPLNIPHESNGVYWYFTKNRSIGFSRVSYINQNRADIATTDGDARLSWYVDNMYGGFRLGSILDLYMADDYMKAVYNCPA